MKKYSIAAVLVFLSVCFRTIWHVGPNIEFITTAAILAAVYTTKRLAVSVPFAAVVISDIVIGNSSIYFFTWSAFLFIGMLGGLTSSIGAQGAKRVALISFFGIPAGIVFYLWTNFGVWLLDPWNMYPDTMGGLLQSYGMGLPFLRNTLAGNIFFGFSSVLLVEYVIPYLFYHRDNYFRRVVKQELVAH